MELKALLNSANFISIVADLILEEMKGGAGSGSWNGPGDPRFAHEGEKEKPASIAVARELAGKHSSWADFKGKLMDYLGIPRGQKWDVPIEWQYAYKRSGGWSHVDTCRQLKLPLDFKLSKKKQLGIQTIFKGGPGSGNFGHGGRPGEVGGSGEGGGEKFSDKVSVKESKYSGHLVSELDRLSGKYPNAVFHDMIKDNPLTISVTDKLPVGRFGENGYTDNGKQFIKIAVDCFIEGGSKELGQATLRHEFGHYILRNLGDMDEKKVKQLYEKHKDTIRFPSDMRANWKEVFAESFSRVTDTKKPGDKVPPDISKFIKTRILKEGKEARAITKSLTTKQKVDWEQRWKKIIVQGEKQYAPKVRAIFESMRNEVMGDIKKQVGIQTILKANFNYRGYKFDKPKWQERFAEEQGDFVKEMYDRVGTEVFDYLKYTTKNPDLVGEFDVENTNVQDFIEEYSYKFAEDAVDVTVEDLQDALSKGMGEGEGIDQIADRIQKVFDNCSDYRAELIARTETIRASNYAAIESYKQSGVVRAKEWLVTSDDRLCPLCEAMDGTVIELDDNFVDFEDEFTGGGETMTADYEAVGGPPLHPNCRCTLIPVVDDQYLPGTQSEDEEEKRVGLGVIFKGEGEGHPFRGNQYTDGTGEGKVPERNYIASGDSPDFQDKLKEFGERNPNFNVNRTGFSGRYDLMIQDPVWYEEKGVHIHLVEMTPKYYMQECSLMHKSSLEQQYEMLTPDLIEKYTERAKAGEKMPLPFLDKRSGDQEGRHRAAVAEKLGLKKIPVLVVTGKKGVNKTVGISFLLKGGSGSGNFGHAGRPGEVGGSGEGGGFTDPELQAVDRKINQPEVLSGLNLPKYLLHVTNSDNLKEIKKNGLQVGKDRLSDTGESQGRVYLSNDPWGIADSYEFDELSNADKIGVVVVEVGKLPLRLDPEFYREYANNTQALLEFANGKNGLYTYTRVDIPKEAIVSTFRDISGATDFIESKKQVGVWNILKGGPGSGSWEGPGDPRFAWQSARDAEKADKLGLSPAKLGKDGKWQMADGKPLPAHIQSQLTQPIPPAWRNVYVNPDAKACREGCYAVRGRDVAGRVQGIYTKDFRGGKGEEKFSRVKELDGKISKVVAENERNLKGPQAENASVLRLIMATGIRPGSDSDTRAAKQAFGATTLLGKHVYKTGDGVELRFTGKKGVEITAKVMDKAAAKDLLDRVSKVGKAGRLFDTDYKSLWSYSKQLDGKGYLPKDFRTLMGTRLAVDAMKKVKAPTNEKEYKKAVKEVATQVSQKLGNTPTIALQAYINPSVFSQWRKKW